MRCAKCGYPFEGSGDYCSGCKNGHGSNRDTDPEITELLDEMFGGNPPPSESSEDDDE